MNSVIENTRSELYNAVRAAALKLYGACPDVTVVHPKDSRNGDFSASAALALGGILKRPPIITAEEIISAMELPQDCRVQAMGKGFINFFLPPGFLLSVIEPLRELPKLEMPGAAEPGFFEKYSYCRLSRVLELQGTLPDGTEDLTLLKAPQEVRLMWAAAKEDSAELAAAAMDFYDKLGLRCGYAPLAMARYALLSSALYTLYSTIRKDQP